MNYEQKAEKVRNHLKQLHEWKKTFEWGELPEGVRRIICRGEIEFEDRLEKYLEWAKQETQAE